MPHSILLTHLSLSFLLRYLGKHSMLLKRSLLLCGAAIASCGLWGPVEAVRAEMTALSFELDETRLNFSSADESGGIIRSYATSFESQDDSQGSHQVADQVSKARAVIVSDAGNGADPIPTRWWTQGSDSPIAVVIGNAEGTRQSDGAKTAAYYWHSDPGNGADNFGTFSYQHFSLARTEAVRAEETAIAKRETAAAHLLPALADQAQMQRLRGFYQQLQHQARTNDLWLTPLEILNGLDLINQSEAAGLSPGGYIDHLVELRGLEEDAEEQIKEARSWAYWHPERKAWDAPGLGNSYAHVRRDQERRFEAVKRAAEVYIPDGKIWMAQTSRGSGISSAEVATARPAQGNKTLRQAVASAVQADSLSFELSRKIALAAIGR